MQTKAMWQMQNTPSPSKLSDRRDIFAVLKPFYMVARSSLSLRASWSLSSLEVVARDSGTNVSPSHDEARQVILAVHILE